MLSVRARVYVDSPYPRGAQKFVAADRPELLSARDASGGHNAPFPPRDGYEDLTVGDRNEWRAMSGRGGTHLGKDGHPSLRPNQGIAYPIA